MSLEGIKIESTKISPAIEYKGDSNVLTVNGRSMPENAVDFFKPLDIWIANLNRSDVRGTNFIFDIDYFNTASSKVIFNILKTIKDIGDRDFKIVWKYHEDDEDMEDTASLFQDHLGDVFSMEPYSD